MFSYQLTFTVEKGRHYTIFLAVKVVLRNCGRGGDNGLLLDQQDVGLQIVNFIARNAAYIQCINMDFLVHCFDFNRDAYTEKAKIKLFHPPTRNASKSVSDRVYDREKNIIISVHCGQANARPMDHGHNDIATSIATLAEDVCCFLQPFSTISSLHLDQVSPHAVDDIMRHLGVAAIKVAFRSFLLRDKSVIVIPLEMVHFLMSIF